MASDLSASEIFKVRGLVVFITGGGSGLGSMIAKALAANGAKAVYIMGRRKEALEATAKLGPSGVIIPIAGDVTSKDDLAAAAQRVRSEHGFINVLVANSGIVGPVFRRDVPISKERKPTVEEFQKGMWNVPMEDFTQALHVNCTAVFFTVVAFLDLLDAGNQKKVVPQKSQVIVVTSTAGLSRVLGTGWAYQTSKAAAHHLFKMLSNYFLTYDIRVNSIAPGVYPSEMTAPMLQGKEKPWEEGSMDRKFIPLGHTGSEENMAGAALYLISPAGSYCSGEYLVTDGGRIAMGLQ